MTIGFFDQDARGTSYVVDGITYRTGAAGTRCLEDVDRIFGEAAAIAIATEAIRRVDEVPVCFPDMRQPRLSDDEVPVTVEAFLLTGGLDDATARELSSATHYRSGPTYTCELDQRGFSVPSDPLQVADDQNSAERLTLHDDIATILREGGNRWRTTTEIADQVNRRMRYTKRDESKVTPFQIHGRTRQMREWFEREGSRVRLRPEQAS
jgi:hypothetical protein